MKRRAILAMLLTAFWATLSWAAPTEPVVHFQNDRLTLDVENVNLATILEKIADQGIHIRIDPRINPSVTARFSRRPIGPAMSSILKSADYALIWRKDRASGPGAPKLWEIRIFYKGQEALIRTLAGSGNLTVVRGTDGTYQVKDILLLRLTREMTEPALATLLDRLGASVIDAFAPLGIVRLRLPHGSDVTTIAEAIAETPGVETAEPDYAYPLEGGGPAPTGEWSAPASAASAPTSGGPVVAIMDSGLRAQYATNASVQSTFDAVSPEATVTDALGHGTQMALIAAGAVNPLGTGPETPPGSSVVAIRAFDDNGFTSTYTLMRGIDFAVSQGARVLSLSWGAETPSALLESATGYAAAKGLILVAAAGNAPTGKPVYPAAYENVIGVGALAPDGKDWDQSNFGEFVAVSAPGMADLPVGYNGDPGVYAGTSIATAYTARRIAAILNRNPDADRSTILRLLKEAN